jgi:hypothetical protein
LKFLKQAHAGFEFTSPQRPTHAYPRFLTPFSRDIIDYGEPVPCWFFNANRPRCGKDYLAGITQITYEGFPFEDAAIGDKPEETCKRITAGLMAGRRFFHFANCQGYLQDKYFIQAITDMIWRDRLMGGNSAANDLQIPNEAEYSISANQGLTCRDDVPPRVRKIGLAFYDEDANNRVFPVEDLHGWVRSNRSTLLSAAFSIFNYWKKQGMPQGKPYSSFKRWGRIIGGVMQSVELGDPTLPDGDDSLFGGDMREDAMTAFYELSYEHRPDLWTAKKEFYTLVAEHQDNDDRLLWFGDFSGEKKKSAQTKLGKAITEFQGRILAGGIQMILDRSVKETQLWRLLFTKKR